MRTAHLYILHTAGVRIPFYSAARVARMMLPAATHFGSRHNAMST